ncbi:MAG: ATP-binding cassette domain-containing protein [Burkholderiaceae bacterium]|jgi:ATP-binding cassette subfamily F protein uup
MSLISLNAVQLAYGHVALLDAVDLSLEAGERVGLIGRNGTGKSSLLRIIAGLALPDDGTVTRQSAMTWALVEQEPLFEGATTVLEAVAAGLASGARALVDYEQAVMRVAAGESGALEELARSQTALEDAGGWNVASRLEAVLEQFQLAGHIALQDLSGGQKKRVALARAFVAMPDLLLLDEPTNHLDFEAIRWLEETLRGFSGTVLFITHDRAFLDAVATRIVELDRGHLRSYPGNFQAYQQRKDAQVESERVEAAKFDKLLAQEEVWIRKGIEARRTRNEGRVRRLEALRRERSARRERLGTARLQVDSGERSGKLVAELEHVSKAYQDHLVVRDFSATLLRGDKVGLIGPNGAGKTTLLKLILREISPDSGTVRQGTHLNVAYFDQMRAQLELDRTVADTISPGSEWVEIGGQRKHVMSYLGDFLFSPERARSPVRSLSGGERNRLLLARLFARPANVLVLDEPTNDLDIDTLELLEELLEDYQGTVFLVSHDRVFLNNVVTQTIAFEGAGVWREYAGGYEDWERARARASVREQTLRTPPAAPPSASRPAKVTGAAPKQPERGASKLGFKERRELDDLPSRIATLETEQTELTARLAKPELYRQGKEEAAGLKRRARAIEQELSDLYARWEELERRNA